LGLYGKACDRFCVLGKRLEEKRKKIEEVLKVKSVALTLSNTDFIGIFCALNENGIVLPKILTNSEREKFFEFKKLFGINFLVLKSKFTAIGNLILCNKKGALLSPVFTRKEKKDIEDCLGVEVAFSKIAGISTVGSCGVATNKGCLLHRDASEEEIRLAEEILKVKVKSYEGIPVADTADLIWPGYREVCGSGHRVRDAKEAEYKIRWLFNQTLKIDEETTKN
jgi:translation initiation factor 6